jgi:protein CpxP
LGRTIEFQPASPAKETRMRKKLVAAGAILVVGLPALLLLGGFRSAQGFRHHGDMMSFLEWRISAKLDELNATDAQKQEVRAVADRLKEEHKALHEQTKGFRSAVLAELGQDRPDPAKIHAIVDSRADAMKAFADKVVDGVLEVHAMLTPDQRKQLLGEFQGHAREK